MPEDFSKRWIIDNLGGGGGGSVEYTNLTPIAVAHGGVEVGDTFVAQTVQQMFDRILYPYQAPAFSSFSISGQASTLEVGNPILANRTFIWGTTNPSNILPNTLAVRDVTAAVDVATGLADDGSEAVIYAPVQHLAPATHTFRLSGLNSKGVTFTRNYSVSWQWRRYYGESVNGGALVEADVEGLRANGLSGGFSGTYAFLGGGYKYIAYASSLGTATSFTDQGTGLNVPFEASYIVSVTNTLGVTTDYRVHRSTNIMGAAINIIVA